MRFVTPVIAGTAALAAGGVLFAGPATAGPPEPVPAATATATHAAGGANAASRGAGWLYGLTDVQRHCLADAEVQRPEGRMTEEQRTRLAGQVRAALTGCGVTLPARLADRPRLGFAWASLSTEQQQCLASTELTRPIGRLTDAERAAVRQSVRDAVKACASR